MEAHGSTGRWKETEDQDSQSRDGCLGGGWRERESGTPTLAATGNPSDGEMGQLLTREIKSRGDGEYLYAHLLTQREDASSWIAVELHFFLDPQWGSLCWGGGGVGSVVLWGQQPHVTFPQRQENKMEDILCQARKLCCDSLVTSHGKGGTAKITLLP